MRMVNKVAATSGGTRSAPGYGATVCEPEGEVAAPGRALVAVTPVARLAPSALPGRASVPFLAHLIATAGHCPQTRALRRASTAEVLHAYRARRGDAPARGPHRPVSRSV